MQNINNASELKKEIEFLQAEQLLKGQLLKDQFYLISGNFKPLNLLKGSISDLATSPYLIENIIGTTLGLTTGYLSKKIFIGASGNIFRKLMGTVLQFGVTNLVAEHPDAITSIGRFIFKKVFRKKESKHEAINRQIKEGLNTSYRRDNC
jgi:hypothetical protein